MRKRLKLPIFIAVIGAFLFCFIIPMILHARTPEATKAVPSPYTEKEFITIVSRQVKPQAQAYGIRPSVVIGQILLESQNGNTLLAHKYHNLFAVEARPGQDSVLLLTSHPMAEYDANSKVRFTNYKDWKASIEDYFRMLKTGQVWDKQLYRMLASQEGYKAPAQALEEYIYPYDKDYSDKLIKVIEEKNLTQYD